MSNLNPRPYLSSVVSDFGNGRIGGLPKIAKRMEDTLLPISIIIPTSRNSPHLAACLDSIRQLEYPKSKIQTIVITNADLRKRGKTFSFARAVNEASKEAIGDYLLITNDDIVFDSQALNAWVSAAKRHPNIILGGKLFDKTTNEPAAAGYTMNLTLGIARPVFTGNKPAPCDWVSGCALFINHLLFKELAGFEEDFAPGFFEDADLCLRAKKKMEVNSLLVPEAKALHAQTATFNRNKTAKYEYWYRNKVLFLRKHASRLQLVSSILIQYALLTPARAVLMHDGRFLPAIKGFWWNIRKKSA